MGLPVLATFANGMGVVPDTSLNSYIQGCLNFAQLRTYTGLDTMQVAVLGQAAPGDGYQGNFYWVSTATGADDNQNTIAPYGAVQGRWLRVPAQGLILSTSRTPISDVNYTMASTDQWISYTALTATRTVTLLTTAAVGVRTISIGDESGNCAVGMPINVVTQSPDKFSASSTSFSITSPYSYVEFRSNGAGLWIVHQ